MIELNSFRHFAMLAATFLWLALPDTASGQSPDMEHTYKLDDPSYRPPAKLDDVDWLVGNWTGEAFGSTFEEVWNPPSAGSMVGMFKVLDDEAVQFYELVLLIEQEESLSLLVKHFNADFTAWEDKEDYVRFRLIAVEENAIHFSGLSFYRINDDEFHAYLILHDEGNRWEEKLVYRRRE